MRTAGARVAWGSVWWMISRLICSETARSVADTNATGDGGVNAGVSLASKDGKFGSVKSMSRLDTSSFRAESGPGNGVDGLPPLQLRQSKKARALEKRYKLQRKAGFDDSFSRSTPRVLQVMSKTDPGQKKRKAGLGGNGGSKANLGSSSQSIAGGRSVASVGSQNSKASRELSAGSSVQDIMALRAELQNTQDGLKHLDTLVDTGLAWVHNHVNIKEITSGTA